MKADLVFSNEKKTKVYGVKILGYKVCEVDSLLSCSTHGTMLSSECQLFYDK